MMRGEHYLLHWSWTQQVVSLSSAEAELNASITAGCEGLLVKNMARELGMEYSVTVLGDSSANSGIVHRSGTGRIKHLSIDNCGCKKKCLLASSSSRKFRGL